MGEKDEVVEILKRAISPPFKAVTGDGAGTVLVSGRNGWVWCRKLGKTELLMQAYNRGAPNIEGVIVDVREARVEGIKGYEIIGVDYATSPSNIYPGVPPHGWTHEWRPGVGRDRVTVYPRAWGYLRAEPIETGSMNVWVTPGWIYYDGAYSYYRGGYSPGFGAPAGATWYQTLYLDPSDETLHITNGVTGGYGYAQVPSPPECMIPIAAVESTGTFSAVTENMIEDIRLFMDPIEECGDGDGVGDHDILDGDVHPDSVAQAVTRGSLIYGDSTPKWNELAIGVAARYLRSDGTDLAWAQIPASEVTNTPAGGIAATDVQAAINELDTEKVGTHNLLDGSVHPDTLARAVSRGSLPYGDSTPKWNELVLGASGTYLHSNGIDVEWSQIPHAELINVGEPFDSHPNNPRCRAYHDADQAVANITWTTLAFNSEEYDNDAIHDLVVNNFRLTCKTAGLYVVTLSLEWESNANGERRHSIAGNIGGVNTTIGQFPVPASPAGHMGFQMTTQIVLAVGDWLRAVVWQNSGVALDVRSTRAAAQGDWSPDFMMYRAS